MNNLHNIDEKIYQYIFSPNSELKQQLSHNIRQQAYVQGIRLSSINNLYLAFGRKEVAGFTVPAFNLRTLTYDIARIIFALAKEKQVGAFIFEIARSEMYYTNQTPQEFVTAILAAAIKEKYYGPIFIQADHFQFNSRLFQTKPEEEINRLKALISEAIAAGFYNIDIDASTLVNLEEKDLLKQQENNAKMTALMTRYIRSLEPKGLTISIGGEIGHIGGRNSTPEDFEAFMDLYLPLINCQGISKVSVQTGSRHGGTLLKNNTIAPVEIDFTVLKTISETAQERYQIGGSVQHGASTLPDNLLSQFPKNKTLEIHFATGLQNIIYDSLPSDLKQKIYQWLKDNFSQEWSTDLTQEQFLYQTRKKALGQFKEKIWRLKEEEKFPIKDKIQQKLALIFEKLNLINTQKIVNNYL
jgi:fructose/tagatose bisphosphate aldolase